MDWISVKDDQPDEGKPVWMRMPGDIIFVGSYDFCGDPEGWLWSNSYGNYWYDDEKGWQCEGEADDDYRPTHWMPLPDPPEEQK